MYKGKVKLNWENIQEVQFLLTNIDLLSKNKYLNSMIEVDKKCQLIKFDFLIFQNLAIICTLTVKAIVLIFIFHLK